MFRAGLTAPGRAAAAKEKGVRTCEAEAAECGATRDVESVENASGGLNEGLIGLREESEKE